jgi:Zn-dependent peptidase ImmA (M78 family)/transcriptional regulator with XRE-family HTH domain
MRLRQAREGARMSQTEVARSLGVTPAAISQYESGRRRIEALLLDRFARLYGVPIRFFFGEATERADWEHAVLHRAAQLDPAAKAGLTRLIGHVNALSELHRRAGVAPSGPMHPPFPPQPDGVVPDREVADWAERVRRHFDLGMAPLVDLRGLLEALGYKVFSVPLGQGDEQLSGVFFVHPELGPIVAVNEDQAYSRRPFTMAHELAHGLFHYDRPAVLCRLGDRAPLERFADGFAAHFLAPREALVERLRDMSVRKVAEPEQVVHLARYFGVSYGAMERRLHAAQLLSWTPGTSDVKPIALARRLGYTPTPYEFGLRPLPPEERLPRIFIELADRCARDGALSLRRVAEMLGISDLELEERLAVESAEEEREPAYA